MGYLRVPRAQGPNIPFRDVQEAVYQYYAQTNSTPYEVVVGSDIDYAGVYTKWSFEKGRVVYYSEATNKPFGIVVDKTLKPDEIVCRSEPGSQQMPELENATGTLYHSALAITSGDSLVTWYT